MRNWLGFLVVLVFALGLGGMAAASGDAGARAAAPPGLVGNWARDDGTVRISLVACGAAFCATNTWVEKSDHKEKVGDELILNVKPVSASVFQGPAYDVRRKLSFSMTITVQGKAMRTSGCVLLGMICKNADWTRVD